jgi:hypothetical protein
VGYGGICCEQDNRPSFSLIQGGWFLNQPSEYCFFKAAARSHPTYTWIWSSNHKMIIRHTLHMALISLIESYVLNGHKDSLKKNSCDNIVQYLLWVLNLWRGICLRGSVRNLFQLCEVFVSTLNSIFGNVWTHGYLQTMNYQCQSWKFQGFTVSFYKEQWRPCNTHLIGRSLQHQVVGGS